MNAHTRDAGLGLLEVLVAASLFLVALTVFGLAYGAANRTAATSQEMGSATDQLRQALGVLDGQVRSGYWVKSATVACKDSNNVSYSCPAVKVLTISRSDPTKRECWVWTLSPWPGQKVKKTKTGPPTDLYDNDPSGIHGQLRSYHYASDANPPAVSNWTWYVESDALSWATSTLQVTNQVRALQYTTLTFATYYTGVSATFSVAQDATRRITVPFLVSVRNQQIGAPYASECSLP